MKLTTIIHEAYCLGQITKNLSREGWCKRCIPDENNKRCPHYAEVKFYEIVAEREGIDCDRKITTDMVFQNSQNIRCRREF